MNTSKKCAAVFDMGGTFLKFACVNEKSEIIGDVNLIPSHSDGDIDLVLSAWETALTISQNQAAEHGYTISGIGVSTPGPFDYAQKTSRMLHKFKSIYGINLEETIRRRIPLPCSIPFIFMQDASAFLAGERLAGAARGEDNCALVTIGTGLGFAAMAKGEFISNGYDSCYVALFRQPCGDGIIEDIVSGRGISAEYKKLSGNSTEFSAKDVAGRAVLGDTAAVRVFERLGTELGRAVGFHLIHIRSDMLVAGGQISKAFDLFAPALKASLRREGYSGMLKRAVFPEDAALYGVAGVVFSEISGSACS